MNKISVHFKLFAKFLCGDISWKEASCFCPIVKGVQWHIHRHHQQEKVVCGPSVGLRFSLQVGWASARLPEVVRTRAWVKGQASLRHCSTSVGCWLLGQAYPVLDGLWKSETKLGSIRGFSTKWGRYWYLPCARQCSRCQSWQWIEHRLSCPCGMYIWVWRVTFLLIPAYTVRNKKRNEVCVEKE